MSRRCSPRPARSRVARALVAALFLSACSGPPDPLDVAVKEVPSDIVLGSPESGAPAPAPVPPAVPVVVGPSLPPSLLDRTSDGGGPQRPGSTTSTTDPGTPPEPCPSAHPFEAPRLQATTHITAPPPTGSLPFRVDGVFEVTGANARTGRFPPDSTRTISAVEDTGTGFTYRVAAELAGTTTTTGYQVVNDSEIPGEPGIYITFIDTEAPSGATSSFRPVLPMKLADLPLIPNTQVTAAGTDPTSATTVSWTTTVGQKARVDACGTPLDAIVVKLTDGRVDGPQTNADFTASYAIATQFGGLSIHDTIDIRGREGLDEVHRRITGTVSADPATLESP